jgi:hypothetical protein
MNVITLGVIFLLLVLGVGLAWHWSRKKTQGFVHLVGTDGTTLAYRRARPVNGHVLWKIDKANELSIPIEPGLSHGWEKGGSAFLVDLTTGQCVRLKGGTEENRLLRRRLAEALHDTRAAQIAQSTRPWWQQMGTLVPLALILIFGMLVAVLGFLWKLVDSRGA